MPLSITFSSPCRGAAAPKEGSIESSSLFSLPVARPPTVGVGPVIVFCPSRLPVLLVIVFIVFLPSRPPMSLVIVSLPSRLPMLLVIVFLPSRLSVKLCSSGSFCSSCFWPKPTSVMLGLASPNA